MQSASENKKRSKGELEKALKEMNTAEMTIRQIASKLGYSMPDYLYATLKRLGLEYKKVERNRLTPRPGAALKQAGQERAAAYARSRRFNKFKDKPVSSIELKELVSNYKGRITVCPKSYPQGWPLKMFGG